MALDDLLETLERRSADTPATPGNSVEVSGIAAPVLACTLDTPDTSPYGHAQSDVRMAKVIGRLHAEPGLRYAVQAHEAGGDAVTLTVAIRGKAACELRIPKSRYDAVALLELLDKHATRVTLQ